MLVFFRFQRAGCINQTTPSSDVLHRGAEDCHLAGLKVT